MRESKSDGVVAPNLENHCRSLSCLPRLVCQPLDLRDAEDEVWITRYDCAGDGGCKAAGR